MNFAGSTRWRSMAPAAILAIISAGSLVWCAFLYRDLASVQVRLNALLEMSQIQQRMIQTQKTILEKSLEGYVPAYRPVDLSAPQIQTIDENCSIVIENVVEHLDGVRVEGLLINQTSIDYSMMEILVRIGSAQSTFTVKHLPAGGSARFKATVLGVEKGGSRFAIFEQQGTTVHYRRP